MTNAIDQKIQQTPLESALMYASLGIPVLPCDPNTKRPLVASKRDASGNKIPKSGGLYLATTNSDEISGWWSKHPNAMIGIPTGSASGFVVIDVDHDPDKGINGLFELKRLEDQYGPLPVTGKVITPRGGTHYYFKLPHGVVIKNSASSIAPGIDIRGEGGYIIGAGSIRADGRRYECVHQLDDCVPIPSWVRSLVTGPRSSKMKIVADRSPSRLHSNSNVSIDKEIAKVADTSAGSRNDTLNRSAFILGRAGHDEELVREGLLEACRKNGLLGEDGEQSILDTIARAYSDGQRAADERHDNDNVQGQKYLEQLNAEYFVAPYGSQVFVCSVEKNEAGRFIYVFRAFEAFRQLHSHISVWDGHKHVKLGQFWLGHLDRRQYAGISFVPNGPDILPSNIKNTWLGFAVTPLEGDCSLVLSHIHNVTADGDAVAAEYILNYLAWTVQHPDKPAEVALIFKGSEGTGKGVIARTMMDFFGSAAIHISSSRHLVGNFNAHLDGTVLLFADEAFWAGDKSARGTFFSLITEPYLTIERKGIDAKQVPNRLHVIMASNEDWVVPAEYDSRRFAVFAVSDCHKQDVPYFKALYHQLDNGGREAFLDYLLKRELGDFHPRQIPKTKAFREQVTHSLGALDTWWVGMLEEGFIPLEYNAALPNVIYINSKSEDGGLFAHMRKSDARFYHVKNRDITQFLRSKGCEPWRDASNRGWKLPSLKKARAEWEKTYGEWEWSNDHEEWNTFPKSIL